MRTRLAALAGIGAVLALAPGAFAETRSFTYVASAAGYTDLDRRLPPGVAPVGKPCVVPKDPSITLYIDDVSVLDGQTVAGYFYDDLPGRRMECIPVRAARTLTGFLPRQSMAAAIFNDVEWLPDGRPGCTGHATAGTAQVTL